MEMEEICPCPNLDCPNHGHCDKCISRHLRMGYLNFCAFHTLLPVIQKIIDDAPESPAGKNISDLIVLQLQVYEKLMEQHGISRESQERLLKKVAEYSDY